MNRIFFVFVLLVILFVEPCASKLIQTQNNDKNSPARVVNIINFIRQSEPRIEAITEDVLYNTVVQQYRLLIKYDMPGTFLLQYDALINPKYQSLLKDSVEKKIEVGAWWEITQPHVEAAGLKWRGQYSWDWHANVGFATGYSPAEREKLVDAYMEKFKSIFGKYPATVGSWFIDAHTLAYMYEKYHIVGSCNCRDQIGTDGYTLWGGYWNNAYYPSRNNAYMPAQHPKMQIPVPVFRMLGSDPIYQYDSGLGSDVQGVETLEPVFPGKGADRGWVNYYFQSTFVSPALNLSYAQTGQENSFTWPRMKDGLQLQIPILDSLRKKGTIRLETLETTSKWFKKRFPVTPPTAVTALNDYRNEGNKTVWYNSRYYRANLLWKNNSFRFRDIHFFDEKMESTYLKKAGTSTQCVFKTLPVVDGFEWSTANDIAGLYLIEIDQNGKSSEVLCGDPVVVNLPNNILKVEWTEKSLNTTFIALFYENHFEIKTTNPNKKYTWALELRTNPKAELPFVSINNNLIKARFNNFNYLIRCDEGTISSPKKKGNVVFRLIPSAKNKIVFNCAMRK